MRHLLVLSVVVLACMVVSSHGFALSKFIAEKKNIIAEAAATVPMLVESAKQKKAAIVDTVKSAAEAKIRDLSNVKSAIISSIGAAKQSKIAALRATKDAIVSKMAQKKKELSGVMDVFRAKAKKLMEYKMSFKNGAASLVSSAVSAVAAKKGLAAKKLEPVTQVHTYTSDEAPIVGKVIVTQTSNTYGPPATTYGVPDKSSASPSVTFRN